MYQKIAAKPLPKGINSHSKSFERSSMHIAPLGKMLKNINGLYNIL
jgi:hypothetical protein